METNPTSHIDDNPKSIKSIILDYILLPLRSAIFGFSIFLSLIILIKLVEFLFIPSSSFALDLNDFLISLIGFGLAFVYSFLDNIKSES
ncbi:hypothetical protein BMS3Abin04_01121 [bacterium BMS3Abin04]|nr:hypothetical protein BMS3Abin04_01121 [bacterium BMS3Abin04]